MKLADWARIQGVDDKTAYRWFRAGLLPIPAMQISTGTILVSPPAETPSAGVALYGRVCSSGQKKDWDRQRARLLEHATANQLPVTRAVKEIGSGRSGRRRKLLALLKDVTIGTILVEHRDRLARFGVEFIEAALAASGRKVEVVGAGEMKDDLVRDMGDVLTRMCARL